MKQLIVAILGIVLLTSMVVVAAAEESTEVPDVEEMIDNADEGMLISPTPTSETVPESEIIIPENETAAVTPANPIAWGAKRFWERARLWFIFGKADKAERILDATNERLLEINQLLEEGKYDEARKAAMAYRQDMEKVREIARSIRNDNASLELKEKLRIKSKLLWLENNADRLETTIQVKVFGNLSEEGQEKVDAILSDLQNTTSRGVIWIEDEVTGAKVRIKARLSISDEEVESIEYSYENELNLTQVKERVLQNSIARLERVTEKARERIKRREESGKDVALANEKLEIAEDLLGKLRELQASNGGWSEIREALHEAKIDARQVYIEQKAARADKAAEVIGNVITKLEERQSETGNNMTNAISRLSSVREKLETRAELLKSISANLKNKAAQAE